MRPFWRPLHLPPAGALAACHQLNYLLLTLPIARPGTAGTAASAASAPGSGSEAPVRMRMASVHWTAPPMTAQGTNEGAAETSLGLRREDRVHAVATLRQALALGTQDGFVLIVCNIVLMY